LCSIHSRCMCRTVCKPIPIIDRSASIKLWKLDCKTKKRKLNIWKIPRKRDENAPYLSWLLRWVCKRCVSYTFPLIVVWLYCCDNHSRVSQVRWVQRRLRRVSLGVVVHHAAVSSSSSKEWQHPCRPPQTLIINSISLHWAPDCTRPECHRLAVRHQACQTTPLSLEDYSTASLPSLPPLCSRPLSSHRPQSFTRDVRILKFFESASVRRFWPSIRVSPRRHWISLDL